MGLFKKPPKPQRRANISPSVSAPIMRYYRPQATSKNTKKENNTTKSSADSRNNARDGDSLLSLVYRWFGVIVILFLVIANTTISEAIVKLDTDNSDFANYRSLQEYNTGINIIFSSSIRNKSKFTLNSSSFEAEIRKKFPEVSNAVVVTPLAGRRLQVGLSLDKPLARLQQPKNNSQAVLSSNGSIVIIDTATVINEKFADLPSISIPNINYSVGDQILTSDEAGLTRLLISEFDGSAPYRYKINSLEYDIQKREIRLKFDNVSFFAKLTPERDSREQVGALVSSLKSLTEQGGLPSEYIDVRVDDRVFVK